MADAAPLDKLPEQLAKLAACVADSADSVKKVSIERCFLPLGRASFLQIPEARMVWRLSMTRKESKTYFFIFTSEKPPYVSLDVLVETSIRLGLPDEAPLGAPDPSQVHVRYPDFFVSDLNEEEFVKFTPPGSTRKNALVLKVGETLGGFLGVRFGEKNQILYSPNKMPGRVQSGPYSLQPFLELIAAIRNWSKSGSPGGEYIQVGVSSQGTVVREIVNKVIEGYTACCEALATRPLIPLPGMEGDSYQIAEYGADLELKLRIDGSLSEKPEQERFCIQLRLRVENSNKPVVEGILAPARLFVSGPLYDSFLENLASFGGSAYLANMLGPLIREDSYEVRRLRAQEFARSAHADSSILLAGSGLDADLYLLLLRGSLYEVPVTLLSVAEFNTESPEEVSWNLEGIMMRLAGFAGDSNTTTIESEDADLVFPIIENIKRWGEFL